MTMIQLFLFPLIILGIILIGVLVFVFWLLMLIDCIKKKKFRNADRLVWILIIIFTGIIGAIIYYFLEKKK